MERPSGQSTKWLSIPIIATISRLLCQELTVQNEYLRLENKILKSKIKGRIQFTDDERRSLVDTAFAMSTQLIESSMKPGLSKLSNQTPLLLGSDVWIRRSGITQIAETCGFTIRASNLGEISAFPVRLLTSDFDDSHNRCLACLACQAAPFSRVVKCQNSSKCHLFQELKNTLFYGVSRPREFHPRPLPPMNSEKSKHFFPSTQLFL